ncbi:MAG: acyltransferase [Sphingobacteriales bacterium]|nr:acyltransferase [Sphingobacteriales bacterium]
MKNRILELDALRGIVALLIVAFHFMMFRPEISADWGMLTVCVDILFMVSGFVISMTVHRSRSWKDFVWNRFSKLYPAYWVSVTFTTVLIIYKSVAKAEPHLVQQIGIRYWANMTMLQYYFNIPSIDDPYWTLIIELNFYLLMGLMQGLLPSKVARVVPFILLICSFLYAFDGVAHHHFLRHIPQWFPLLHYFPLFLAGIILYRIQFEGGGTWQRWFWLASTYFCQGMMFENCYRNTMFLSNAQYWVALGAAYGLLILFVRQHLKFIVMPATLWAGKISYSLYLSHQFLGISLLIPGMMKYLHLNFWTAAGISFAIALAVGYLINICVETPFLQKLRRIYYLKASLSKPH